MPNLFFFLNLEFFFYKIGTWVLFPIKRREKPNLNRRDDEVIDGQSWLIDGQRRKVEDDSNVM